MNNLMCPVSDRHINENVSRVTASVIFILTVLFIVFDNYLFLAFVLFDFSFRIFESLNFSPVSWFVRVFWKYFKLPVKKTGKAPKVFAARLGFLMSAVSLGLFFFFPVASYVIAGILAACAFADAVFNYCIGCVVYHYAVYPFFKND